MNQRQLAPPPGSRRAAGSRRDARPRRALDREGCWIEEGCSTRRVPNAKAASTTGGARARWAAEREGGSTIATARSSRRRAGATVSTRPGGSRAKARRRSGIQPRRRSSGEGSCGGRIQAVGRRREGSRPRRSPRQREGRCEPSRRTGTRPRRRIDTSRADGRGVYSTTGRDSVAWSACERCALPVSAVRTGTVREVYLLRPHHQARGSMRGSVALRGRAMRAGCRWRDARAKRAVGDGASPITPESVEHCPATARLGAPRPSGLPRCCTARDVASRRPSCRRPGLVRRGPSPWLGARGRTMLPPLGPSSARCSSGLCDGDDRSPRQRTRDSLVATPPQYHRRVSRATVVR